MPITELRPRETSKGVAWFRPPIPERISEVLASRGLFVKTFTEDSDVLLELQGVAGVICEPGSSKLSSYISALEKVIPSILNNGSILVIITTNLNREMILNLLKRLKVPILIPEEESADVLGAKSDINGRAISPTVFLIDAVYPIEKNFDFLCFNFNSQPPNRSLRIHILLTNPGVEHSNFNEEENLLLKRAFHDCSELTLRPLSGGRTSARVFSAYATLDGRPIGQWPLPYLVKMDKRTKIVREYRNYEDAVDPFVPFHLGPHLIRDRCCLGARKGVLVGDFVEESEEFLECASAGRSTPAIACLFDRTLNGWYRSSRMQTAVLMDHFRFNPAEYPKARFQQAQTLGAKKSPAELWAKLTAYKAERLLVGQIHGDLHGANIRVRGNEAIIIDFYSSRPAPLVGDAACLETSLLVEGFTGAEPTAEQILEQTMNLYDHLPIARAPIPPDPKNPSCWFHACVRQVRLYAAQMQTSNDQYARALAAALLMKSRMDSTLEEPLASKRVLAYLIAERILDRL
ncbi:MAG: hypothetical protein P4L11_00125 [Geothrix sp.]|nr:hypothetical protein [Geothrix sp.]